jgi:hypothetical protein
MMDFTPVPEIEKAARPWAKVIDIGPPPGIGDKDCGTANSLVEPGTGPWEGATSRYTYFRPTDEELGILCEGGLVRFNQIGGYMVPHSARVVKSD